jgi:hypothetical protein
MHAGMKLLATAGAAMVCAAGAPAAASAAITGSVVGDAGTPVALAANGAATAIRNMDVQALSHVDDAADARSFSAVVTDAGGVGASTASPCWISKYSADDKRYVDYHGNGTYKLTLTTYTDTDCKTGAKAYVYSWTVGAGVGLAQPGGAFLTRAPNSFSTNTQAIDFAGNPGAGRYEIKYALGGVVTPDGSISGPVKDAFVDSTTGKVQLTEHTPGTYVMVARAVSGSYASPWSAPVTIQLIAPFDLSSRSFPDAVGPTYQVRGIVGETSAGGRVTVSAARGKKGGRYRTLGKAKVNSKGIFKLRFRLKKLGVYRIRYSYKGSSTVAKGSVTEVVRIRRTRVGS